jgi:hypothetical protein
MKRLFLALLAALSLTAIGCQHHSMAGRGCGNAYCDRCGGVGQSQVPRLPHGAEQQMGPAGPATAAYGYPYYTTRGPRDFLMANPPSIGN